MRWYTPAKRCWLWLYTICINLYLYYRLWVYYKEQDGIRSNGRLCCDQSWRGQVRLCSLCAMHYTPYEFTRLFSRCQNLFLVQAEVSLRKESSNARSLQGSRKSIMLIGICFTAMMEWSLNHPTMKASVMISFYHLLKVTVAVTILSMVILKSWKIDNTEPSQVGNYSSVDLSFVLGVVQNWQQARIVLF